MKSIRWVTIALVFVIVFSVWSPVLAKTDADGSGTTRVTQVSLTVTNRSFGALLVDLEGSAGTYSFYVPQGKYTYQIAPGKYTYTVHFAPNSLCKGWRTTKFGDYLVKTRKFTNLKNVLGPYRYCTLK